MYANTLADHMNTHKQMHAQAASRHMEPCRGSKPIMFFQLGTFFCFNLVDVTVVLVGLRNVSKSKKEMPWERNAARI